MKVTLSLILSAGFALVWASMPVRAHHSAAAQYDRNKPATITGSVTKVEWSNPHARFFINTKDSSGKLVNWEVELASPNGLMRRGWTRNSLKVGESVTVNGSLAKDGSNLLNASTVTLASGQRVFAGSSGDPEQ